MAPAARSCVRGMTLIELMVGLVIGLLTTAAIMNVLAVAEGQRRAATTGSDAQINGTVALDTLRRDILQAGYGLAAYPAALGCTVSAQYNSGTAWTFTLAPVQITDGGAAGAPDSILVLASGKTAASVPMLTTAAHTASATSFTVQSSYPTVAGDLLMAVPETWDTTTGCTLLAATAVTSTVVTHDTTSGWNATQSALLPATLAKGSVLLNLGSLVYRTWSVSSANALQAATLSSSTGTTTTQEAFPEIVDLQALYGKDTTGDGTIDSYDTSAPTTVTGWQRVLAIRVAVVARGTQYQRETVTSAVPQWNLGTAVTASNTSTCSDGSGGQCIKLRVDRLDDWQHYRYKVFDTLVPLRNVLWNAG
ncbi:PilW family protein [Xylophilus sp.]|uniref:PilW family protein n=1 Tax=Xylophilus sp. TaxID=2653893 RepID=UPI0013B68D4E|nr:PilW family protein [Xylophilus sp.]KAF1046654.1 MAG: hypothetical protein GAK38_02390 [Xylophilus sp.]